MTEIPGRVLIVDDDNDVRRFYSKVFEKNGFVTAACSNLTEMKETLSGLFFDAIFLDLNLGADSGMDGLPYVLKHAPYSKVFILSSRDDLDTAVECMKKGANWYFTKDSDPSEIIVKVKSFLAESDDHSESSHNDGKPFPWKEGFIGESDSIMRTCEIIEKIKNVDSTVLLLGESGTGKEVVARSIHKASNRSKFRFEAINCGAIPENLLESELFGHKKGAFTDAKQDRKGIFELCSSGTLLLDEIGDMPLNLQTKLLRVLQEKKITPIGSNSSFQVNTRIIAATHRDIEDEVKSHRFREDLYYRISVVVVKIPPLRHRKSDIPLLIRHFLEKFNTNFSKHVQEPSPSVINKLQVYDWPGNIRELQNAIERGVILSSNDKLEIENMFSHLKPKSASASFAAESLDSVSAANAENPVDNPEIFDLPLTDAKQWFEKTYITRQLKKSGGNIAELARRSGRYRADLYRMLERYDINVDDFRSAK